MSSREIPNLSKGEFGFEGSLILKAWSGFQNRNGPYNSIASEEKSDGSCSISIGGDMVEDNPQITDSHINAYNYLISHQEVIKTKILEALFIRYKSLQDEYGYEGEEKDAYMPDVKDVNDFKSLIGISNIHLLNVEKDGIAYVGYEFGCTWDEEHGLGFMTHKDKIIEIGGADSSFLTWIAESDLNPIKDKDGNRSKPWWKFW